MPSAGRMQTRQPFSIVKKIALSIADNVSGNVLIPFNGIARYIIFLFIKYIYLCILISLENNL